MITGFLMFLTSTCFLTNTQYFHMHLVNDSVVFFKCISHWGISWYGGWERPAILFFINLRPLHVYTHAFRRLQTAFCEQRMIDMSNHRISILTSQIHLYSRRLTNVTSLGFLYHDLLISLFISVVNMTTPTINHVNM